MCIVNTLLFFDFQGFNDRRRKKLKEQPLEASQLKTHAEVLLSICARPIMKTTPAWESAFDDIKSLSLSFMSYHDYLVAKKKDISRNQNLSHPVRQVSENTSVWTVHNTKSTVNIKYHLLDKALSLANFLEPVFFDEETHLETQFSDGIQRFRFFDQLQLSVSVDIFKYCPGGGIITVYCLFKVHDIRSDAEKLTQTASVMAKVNKSARAATIYAATYI